MSGNGPRRRGLNEAAHKVDHEASVEPVAEVRRTGRPTRQQSFNMARGCPFGTIGNGGRGDLTAKIQDAFFEITSGKREPPGSWLTYVREEKVRTAVPPATGAGENGASDKKRTTSKMSPTIEPELVATGHAVAADRPGAARARGPSG